jgi:hypothetical protein
MGVVLRNIPPPTLTRLHMHYCLESLSFMGEYLEVRKVIIVVVIIIIIVVIIIIMTIVVVIFIIVIIKHGLPTSQGSSSASDSGAQIIPPPHRGQGSSCGDAWMVQIHHALLRHS